MKKLLLVTGVLALSLSAFATSAHDAKEATVEVKAKVVQPLVIETTPLDYGIMIPGETKWGDTPGTVKITGTSGENIKFSVKTSKEANYEDYKGPKQKFNVTLLTGDGSAENQKLKTELTLFTPGDQGDSLDGKTITLDSKGEKTFLVNGPATASQNQAHGEYKGLVYVRAMYE